MHEGLGAAQDSLVDETQGYKWCQVTQQSDEWNDGVAEALLTMSVIGAQFSCSSSPRVCVPNNS